MVTIILHRNRHRSPLVNLVHSLMNWVIPRARSTSVTIILHRSHHRSPLINLVHSLINRVVPRARSAEHGARSTERGARSAEHGARSTKRGARSAEHGARSTRKREQIDWMILSILIRIYVRDPDQNLRSSSSPSKLKFLPPRCAQMMVMPHPNPNPNPLLGRSVPLLVCSGLHWNASLGSLRREIPGRTSRNHTDGRGM